MTKYGFAGRRLRMAWAAGVVTAGVLVSSLLLAGPTANAQPQRPGPGIGDNPGTLAGAPVRLSLPPGYALTAVRGGRANDYFRFCDDFDLRQPPARCALDRGIFELALVFEVDTAALPPGEGLASNCSGRPVEFSGWVLTSESGESQNILVPVNMCLREDGSAVPMFTYPRPTDAQMRAGGKATVELTLGGYCINLSRHAPSDEDVYQLGVVAADPGLRAAVAVLESKQLLDETIQYEVQNLLWDYTEGLESLQTVLEDLRALPDKEP